MPFAAGDMVRSVRQLQMAGFSVPAGSQGTVTSVMLQTSVLFTGFDTTLVVPDGDLEAVPNATGPATAPLQRVRATVTTHSGGLTIPQGAIGTVTSDAPLLNACWVLFDGMPTDVLIPKRLVEPV